MRSKLGVLDSEVSIETAESAELAGEYPSASAEFAAADDGERGLRPCVLAAKSADESAGRSLFLPGRAICLCWALPALDMSYLRDVTMLWPMAMAELRWPRLLSIQCGVSLCVV